MNDDPALFVVQIDRAYRNLVRITRDIVNPVVGNLQGLGIMRSTPVDSSAVQIKQHCLVDFVVKDLPPNLGRVINTDSRDTVDDVVCNLIVSSIGASVLDLQTRA